MERVLRVAAYLAGAVLVASLVLLLLGLAMAARPEFFGGLGLDDPGKAGLIIALVAGAGVVSGAVASRILTLLLRDAGDERGSYS